MKIRSFDRYRRTFNRSCGTLYIFNYRVSKKIVDLFSKLVIFFYFSRTLSKIWAGKMVRLCFGEDSIHSSTSTESEVIIISNCFYDIIVVSSAMLKTQMALSEKIIRFTPFCGLHFNETRLPDVSYS